MMMNAGRLFSVTLTHWGFAERWPAVFIVKAVRIITGSANWYKPVSVSRMMSPAWALAAMAGSSLLAVAGTLYVTGAFVAGGACRYQAAPVWLASIQVN